MEILYEFGTIINCEKKTARSGKEYWDIELNGKKFRSWNDPELTKGDKGRLTYRPQEEGSKYPPTALGFVLGDGIAPQQDKPVVEEIEDTQFTHLQKKESMKPQETLQVFVDKEKKITLGQAVNLAQTHLFHNNISATLEEFDKTMKETTKRYFKLLQELQEELLH